MKTYKNQYTFRFSDVQKEHLQRRADCLGLTWTEYIRSLIAADMCNHSLDTRFSGITVSRYAHSIIPVVIRGLRAYHCYGIMVSTGKRVSPFPPIYYQ